METIIILRCRSSFDCETIFMVVKVTGLFGLGFFSRSHIGKSLEFDFLSMCLCAAEGRYLPVSCFKVVEGAVASLSCQYSVKRYGLSRVCWGRGCGTFWCSNILVQTDEHGIISKVS